MFLASPKSPPLRVAIIRTSSIGDVVLSTVCLDMLARLSLPVQVSWIGRKPSLSLLAEAYPDLTTIDVDRIPSTRDIVAQLADAHILIDLQANLRSRMIGQGFTRAYGRKTYRLGKESFRRSRLVLGARLQRSRRLETGPRVTPPTVHRYRDMAAVLMRALEAQLPEELLDELKGYDARPLLPVPDRECFDAPWFRELHYGSWVAVAPGAAYATKEAPLSKLAEILGALGDQADRPIGLVLLGSNADRERCVALLDHLGWRYPVLNLAGELSLWQNALALSQVCGLIGNDSALAHISEAVATPTAVLFGPTVEAFGFSPHLRQSRTFSLPLNCRPCSKHGKTPCRFRDQRCFRDLDPRPIARRLGELVAEREGR